MKRLHHLPAAVAASFIFVGACASGASAAPPVACGSVYDFFFTACPLTWDGVTFYGTVDMGGNYSTEGAPFDRNHPTGELYLLGAGGTYADNRQAGFFLGPNGMSQSNVGVKWSEPVGGGWSFVGVTELAFDPYSALLANAPQALQGAANQPITSWQEPFDSSRWGWLAASIYTGVSNPILGTLTFGRQNSLLNDAVSVYDPMAASYAFSIIGFSGKMAGAGDTEDARWTTAIKYRDSLPTSFGSVRVALEVQPVWSTGYFGGYNPNNGAVSGGLGGDVKGIGPGILSMDFFGTYERDAINVQAVFAGDLTGSGWPTGAGLTEGAFLKSVISNQTSFTAVAKYSFGSWGDPSPVLSKAPPAPSGIPLTFYAGYEWIRFTNPSDPTNSFRDDGFLFLNVNGAGNQGCGGGTPQAANGTCIANGQFGASCDSGGGCTPETFMYAWAGAKYGITRNLDIIGAYYHEIQNSFVVGVAGCGNASTAAVNSKCYGFFDAYSVVLDWRFLPKWDFYIGTMYSAAFGGLAAGDIARNDLSTTAGVRFRF